MVEYLPVLIFLLIATAFPVVGLLASRILLQTVRPDRVKLEPYECGIKPESSAHERFSIRFYVIAILFVVFDVETIFLFPWAVVFRELGSFGLAAMAPFMLLLIASLVYAWKRGALEWD